MERVSKIKNKELQINKINQKNMKPVIIIPAYNEATRISEVLEKLMARGHEIIVVDDGSSDNTFDKANEFPINVARHHTNLGQGAALKTGTELAKKLNYDLAIHFDADGQHRLEDLEKMIELLKEKNLDVVLGSRFLGLDSKLPWKKRLIYWFARRFSRKVLQLDFTDPQNGLRALRLDKLSLLDWQKYDFQHCSEILGLIKKNKLNYQEIPIKVNYDEYSQNKKVSPGISMGFKMIIDKLFN